MNIAFPFVILMSQNYIQRNKLYDGNWKTFMVLETKIKDPINPLQLFTVTLSVDRLVIHLTNARVFTLKLLGVHGKSFY